MPYLETLRVIPIHLHVVSKLFRYAAYSGVLHLGQVPERSISANIGLKLLFHLVCIYFPMHCVE